MSAKSKPPSRPGPYPAPHPGSQPRSAPPRPSLPQADSRWQRTVRYGWDKGGARGGRK